MKTKLEWRALSRAARVGRLLALMLALASGPVLAAFDLPALMRLLGQHKSGQASFTEQRFVRGLDAPLSASGTLSFVAPDRFTRNTLEPRPESMVVEGNQITLTRSGRSRSLQLDATPAMLGLVEAVRGTLTGNAQALNRHFRSTLIGSPQAWTLDLLPLEASPAAVVRRVRIAGQQGELRRIEMELADGDRSVMTIAPLGPAAAPASAP